MNLPEQAAAPAAITTLGILGAGIMGTSVAADAVRQGIDVVITDAVESAWAGAGEQLRRIGRLGAESGQATGQVTATGRLDALADCDVVLESVTENLAVKRSVLGELDRRLAAQVLLATNTSTIPIARLAQAVASPERFCGIHFFLPVEERPVVEVIAGPATSARACWRGVELAAALGKQVLPAPDTVGFVVNRVMLPYVSESMQLLTEGAGANAIENTAMGFGMPIGPLAMLDAIGLDTALACGWVFSGAYEDRIAVSPLLVAMVKAGRLGRKTQAGFFQYRVADSGNQEPHHDPAASALVERWAVRRAAPSVEEIAARLFLPMVFEGTRILEEHGTCAADVDLGVVLGLGMSPGRGGPLFWADRLGAARVIEMAEPLAPLGKRMEPPERLRRMARENTRFYPSGDRDLQMPDPWKPFAAAGR